MRLLASGVPNCNASQGGLLFAHSRIILIVLTLDDWGFIKALFQQFQSHQRHLLIWALR
jgi:hypothetical protein